MTPERKVKDKVKKILKKLDCYYTMPVASGYGNSGVPDFLICCKGRFVAIECKAGSNKPTELQLLHLKNIADCGGVSMVVNEENVLQLELQLEEIIK